MYANLWTNVLQGDDVTGGTVTADEEQHDDEQEQMFGYEQQEELDQQAMEGLVLGLTGAQQSAEMGEALAAAYQDDLNQYEDPATEDDVYHSREEGIAASQSAEEGLTTEPEESYAHKTYGTADEQLDTTMSTGEEDKLGEIKDENEELPAADSTSGLLVVCSSS